MIETYRRSTKTFWVYLTKVIVMEKFYFFNSFLDTARAIEDKELRLKYLMAVAEYWLEWKKSDDPIIKALMVQTEFTLDRSKEISKEKSEYMKGNQNAVKNYEKLLKQRKTEKNRNEQKKQEEEVEVEEEYIKKKINKKKFLDFVLLTDDEYFKLVNQFWEKLTSELIDKLNNYIWSTWKRYKSHYFTIMNRSKKENLTPLNMERQDDVEKALSQIPDKNLKTKLEFELDQRRKNWLNVNMQILENILNRLQKTNAWI